jgi:hypothetical protein
MGRGDEIMATGLARGAIARGKRVGFGDGRRIIWGPHCKEIFRGNPNIAWPGEERGAIEWIAYYKGHRLYHVRPDKPDRWIFNYDFRAQPGEFFFDEDERRFAQSIDGDFVLIEPNVPWCKKVAANKDWGFDRYQQIADRLFDAGERVMQFADGKLRLARVEVIAAKTFRHAAAALGRARLAIVPEGGLHHAAAAVGCRAVVIFGGWTPTTITGYQGHVNLGVKDGACGLWRTCEHCRREMDRITVNDVWEAVVGQLSEAQAEPSGTCRLCEVGAR